MIRLADPSLGEPDRRCANIARVVGQRPLHGLDLDGIDPVERPQCMQLRAPVA
jgi:hypothetical protein